MNVHVREPSMICEASTVQVHIHMCKHINTGVLMLYYSNWRVIRKSFICVG